MHFQENSSCLTHWCQVTHICIDDLTITGSDNGLSSDPRQAITWTNARILLIGPLGTNFSEILIKIQTFSFRKMHLKTSSVKRRPFCFSLNVLRINDVNITGELIIMTGLLAYLREVIDLTELSLAQMKTAPHCRQSHSIQACLFAVLSQINILSLSLLYCMRLLQYCVKSDKFCKDSLLNLLVSSDFLIISMEKYC